MFAIARQHIGSDDPQLAKEESNDGQLKHHAHNQRQRYECGDVRIKGDVAHYLCRNAISAEETEGDREQHEIGHQYTKQKQHVDDTSHLHRIFSLVLIEGWRDEAEGMSTELCQR